MTFLIVLAIFVLVGAVGMLFGADTRPGGGDRPQREWPFYRHGG